LPFTVTVPGDIANIGSPATYERANVVGDWRLSNRSPARWFNTAAFVAPPQYTYGNEGRNVLRGDWTRQLDASIFRQFPIRERMRFELRLEMFNSTNTPVFALPDANLASAYFGQSRGTVNAPGSRVMQLGAKMNW